MKIALSLLFASLLSAQCQTQIGGPVCNLGKSCVNGGVSGSCTNIAPPFQRIMCGCATPPDAVPISLDNNWIAFLGNHKLPTEYMTTLPGSRWQADLTRGGWDNPADDGLLSNPPLTFQISSDPAAQGFGSYVWQTFQPSVPMQIGGTLTMAIQFSATPGTTINWINDTDNTCPSPAAVHLMIAGQNNEVPYEPFADDNVGRWWFDSQVLVISDLSGNAIPGAITFRALIDPSQWSGVFGESGLRADGSIDPNFLASLAGVNNVAITLGGGCFFGHGIVISVGSASITILSASYEP